MGAKDVVRRLVRPLGVDLVPYREQPVDFTPEDVELLRRVRPYTMTTPERVHAAANAARYVADAKVPGAIVECGVWRGGSSMAMALALLSRGESNRDLYLFDTYEGMSAPTEADLDHAGRPAREKFEQTRTGDDSADWCAASLNDVRANVELTGYPTEHVHLVKGKVEETLPEAAPDEIALLRLDTDWYESTKHELVTLYPRLVSGGVLILDDYGHWQGSRRAVDEYLDENGLHLLLNRIDYTGRIAVKP